MAYRAIAQVDHDAVSDSDTSDRPSSAPAHHGSQSPVEPVGSVQESTAAGHLGSLIQSIRGNSSYEMVEDDDYEAADPDSVHATSNSAQTKPSSPGAQHDPGPHARHSNPPLNPPRSHSSSPEPLVRTSSGSAVLRHPTPDLQSLQGAYVGNIERLEKSAERLSMTSSDLGAELRKLDLEQKRRSSASSVLHVPDSPARQFSAGSVSNSIIGVNSAARTGGPEHEEDHQDNAAPGNRDVPLLANPPPPPPQRQGQDYGQVQDYDQNRNQNQNEGPAIPSDQMGFTDVPLEDPPDRPSTAFSTDTYQQATNLFSDFDGVHCVPYRRDSSVSRQYSLNKPPLASDAQYYEEPQAGQNLVYYPAPIPKVLNLPQRLSKRPPVSEHEKRRAQLLNTIAADDKAAEGNENRKGKRASNIPPQLRASVFFEQPSSSLNIQMKDQSAVVTLDSILDASAHAPVTAFTDHPIVGHVGSEVYGKASKKPSSKDLAEKKKKRRSKLRKSIPNPESSAPHDPSSQAHGDSDQDVAEATPLRNGGQEGEGPSGSDRDEHDGSHSSGEDDHDDEESSEGQEEEPIPYGRPTTLLAELERRKHEQKQRNRTAATAFPNGMHSTLLELDAVAQAQSNARRNKQVTLAWEASPSEDPDAEDDEDVPLGVLYAGKSPVLAERRPLGLLERRELEDNEPLSRRRARLRGEAPPDPMPTKRASTMMHPPASGPAESDSDENETLAQRLRRLKAQNQSKSVISSDFANEIMAELNNIGDPPPEQQKNSQPEGPVDEEEETLGQRKKRLQAEAKAQKAERGPDPKVRRSMADILQAYPSSNARHSQAPIDNPRASRISTNQAPMHPNRMSAMYSIPPNMTYPATGLPHYPSGYGAMPGYGMPSAYGNGFHNNSFMHSPSQMGMNGFGSGMPQAPGPSIQQPTIDPKQREMIDRWRQSIAM
ncbi:hypothetical protein T310_4265 [Rasamsonia emersonii CBS 393.64]|uniref:Uncharacterized protein n=1 Tax=Rasamsonia emersonii (strain ATCC 16479 / CBS 393.64 / IMI 116815) TaxID=1408163 RepID=A0A0F4YU37_RASE3|nr:hypothetical protein T310_4265 [Rasamsonia emersonii CBS 393.64]KKA21744.1 hypothetical protein T310_4265 [Rasamsonia emersonii CBS 393.64]